MDGINLQHEELRRRRTHSALMSEESFQGTIGDMYLMSEVGSIQNSGWAFERLQEAKRQDWMLEIFPDLPLEDTQLCTYIGLWHWVWGSGEEGTCKRAGSWLLCTCCCPSGCRALLGYHSLWYQGTSWVQEGGREHFSLVLGPIHCRLHLGLLGPCLWRGGDSSKHS